MPATEQLHETAVGRELWESCWQVLKWPQNSGKKRCLPQMVALTKELAELFLCGSKDPIGLQWNSILLSVSIFMLA